MQSWLVYIIEASDGSLYTGITTDIERRWREHSDGKGARYFWGRSPSSLAYVEACQDRSGASRREAAIKHLTRKQKQLLIQSSANALARCVSKGPGKKEKEEKEEKEEKKEEGVID